VSTLGRRVHALDRHGFRDLGADREERRCRAAGTRSILCRQRPAATWVDVFTGAGLDDALRRASVGVDVNNPAGDGSADPVTVFTRSTRILLAAEVRFGAAP